LKEDILALLLQTENDYRDAIKAAVEEGEQYVAGRRKEQESLINKLRADFRDYEESESEKLERTLLEECDRMENEAVRFKIEMKRRQEEKADQISQRLKEEVLSLLWR